MISYTEFRYITHTLCLFSWHQKKPKISGSSPACHSAPGDVGDEDRSADRAQGRSQGAEQHWEAPLQLEAQQTGDPVDDGERKPTWG